MTIVVGLGHVAGVGKDVAASVLIESLGFVRLSTADMIREQAWELNPYVQIDGIGLTRYQNAVEMFGADAAKRTVPEVRRIQQEVGQVMRRLYGDDFWLDMLFREVAQVERAVIPDIRFPNEADMVHHHDGLLIRIDRPGVEPLDHITDTALLDYTGWDRIVDNDSTEDQLRWTMSQITLDFIQAQA